MYSSSAKIPLVEGIGSQDRGGSSSPTLIAARRIYKRNAVVINPTDNVTEIAYSFHRNKSQTHAFILLSDIEPTY
jgi:hypothetical protein